jgi:ribosomal protein L7Ae-like RNA K-turn-binding protein
LDCDDFVKQKVEEAIGNRQIGLKYFDTKSKLGALVGIEVPAAVVGLRRHD